MAAGDLDNVRVLSRLRFAGLRESEETPVAACPQMIGHLNSARRGALLTRRSSLSFDIGGIGVVESPLPFPKHFISLPEASHLSAVVVGIADPEPTPVNRINRGSHGCLHHTSGKFHCKQLDQDSHRFPTIDATGCTGDNRCTKRNHGHWH